MFYFRINQVAVSGANADAENELLGSLGSDASQLKLLSFITSDHMDLPDVEGWQKAGSKSSKKAIETAALEDAIGRRILTAVPGMQDGRVLTFGDTGYMLHQSEFMPTNLDWVCLLVKSDRDLRKAGLRPEEFLEAPEYPDFFKNLAKLVQAASGLSSQKYVAGVQTARFISSVLARALKESGDTLLGYSHLSLNRTRDYPDGILVGKNLRDLTGSIALDYALFGFDPQSSTTTDAPESESILDAAPAILAPTTGSPTAAKAKTQAAEEDEEEIRPARPISISTGPLEPQLLPQPAKRVERTRLAQKRVFSLEGSDSFFFVTGMTINADGSPHAYHPAKGKGLDYLANAGKPGNWWALATNNGKSSGTPVIQGANDPAPGFYVSMTALGDGSKPGTSPARYVDSESVPFFVLPSSPQTGAKRGDIGMIINLTNRKRIGAIYADVGPKNHLGEASIAAAKALGINSNAKRGGTAKNVLYVVFPGSRQAPTWPVTKEDLQSQAEKLFKSWGGMAAVNSLYPNPITIRGLQQALNSQGANIDEDGVWGPNTEGALRNFQVAHNLPGTGVIDAATAKALKVAKPTAKSMAVPSTGSTRTRLLNHLVALAQGEVGVREIGGNNRGADIVKYQKASWLDPGAWPWCAAFICWLYREGMRELDITSFQRPRTAGAYDFENWARKQGHQIIKKDSVKAQKGDLIVFDFSHIGIVEADQKTSGSSLQTIEGNTNGKGDRDSTSGDGVWRKTRKNSLRRSLIRLQDSI